MSAPLPPSPPVGARRRVRSGLTLATALLMGVSTAVAPGALATVVSVQAAPSAPTQPCPPPTDSGASSDPARAATVSASYTAAWNNIASVNDGTALYNGGAQNQVWGTYAGANRPAQQWLQYDWAGPSTLTGASISFWSDNPSDQAGDGVAVPRAWKLQAWDGSAWQDVPLASGGTYGRDKAAPNTVTFAQPVVTTRLRALFDAATNGSTFAAMAVSEFGVTGTAPANPKQGTEVLTSDSFNVGISRATGGVYTLQNAADGPECTNYVANPTHRPNFDVDDSRWTGDVLMKVNGNPRVTGLSDDIRTVSRSGADEVSVAYSGNAANQYGIRDFGLTEKYALTGTSKDVLNWSLTVDNTSNAPMEIQDLGLPLLMNSWWDAGNQTDIYEQNVARHSFIADDGSYMYWQRPNGQGPYLVMVPDANTSIEFKDRAHYNEGPFAQKDPAWEGVVDYYIHSKSIAPTRVGQNKAAQYLPSTSATLAAGQKASYGFTFRWAKDYKDLRNVLYEAGVVDTVSLPGMVIPTDTTATLAVRAKDGIDSVVPGGGTGTAGANATVTAAGEKNGYKLYNVKLNSLGENFITVNYAGGKKSVLQYYSIEPVETLIDANANFLATKQQSTDKARGYDGAFLQWDMRSKQAVTRQNIDSIALTGLDEFARLWMTGGSDDMGLSPAAFLAEKNAVSPDAKQVSSIDYYIDNFLLGYLQNQFKNGQRTWNVYHWYDGGDGDRPATGSEAGDGGVTDGLATWRVMNSPHVWNTYFGMYRIAKNNPELTERPAAEYLDMAYRTMKAYFEHQDAGKWLPNSSRDMASMGESTEPAIMDALTAEGRTSEAAELKAFFKTKHDEYAKRAYPFASEASIDTTAFEANYTMAKLFDDDNLADKVTSASLAARGTQPLWYYYGSDNRHMGESWWNLGYETQIGAWQQQDYLLNYDAAANGFDPSETMRSTYGAYLGGWANINSGQISADPANYGAASWQYQSEKGNSNYSYIGNLNGWWAWSGESALGFWGGVRTAAVNVVDDSIVGTYAYGGDLTVTGGASVIVPKDGVRQRLNMFTKNKFGFELQGATYTKASIADDLRDLTLSVEGTSTQKSTINLRNLPAGPYAVTVDGKATAAITSDGAATQITLNALGAGVHDVRITADTTAPALSAITASRTSDSEARITLTSTEAGSYYVASVDAGAPAPSIDTAGTGSALTAGEQTLTVSALTTGAKDIYLAAKDTAGNVGSAVKVPVASFSQPPGTPTEVTAIASPGAAKVTWKAPTSTGGSPITGYTVTASPGGATCTTTGETTCTVSGLTNGTAYTFTVTASTKAGTSSPSNASAAITPTAAPTAAVTLTTSNPASADGWYTSAVLVRVGVPAGSAKGYRADYSINGGSWRSTTTSTSTTLSNSGTYSLKTRLLKDNVIVPGSETEQAIKIDRSAPGVLATRSPQGTGTPRNPVTVTFAASDPFSGVHTVEYQINGGSWTVVPDGGVKLATVGDYVVAYRATDNAGNVAAVKTTAVSITADPTTALTASSSKITAGQPVTFTLKGFTRYDTVSIKVGSATWGTVLTDVNGTAKITVTVPASQTKGQVTATATGTDPGISAAMQLTVR